MRSSSAAILAVVILTGCQSNTQRTQAPLQAPQATTEASKPGVGVDAEVAMEKARQTSQAKLFKEYRAALVFMEGRQDHEAEQALRDIIRRSPSYPGPHANLGILYHRQGNLAQALESLNRALLLNPDNAVVQNRKGMVLREMGRFQEAADAYVQANRADPSYSDAYLNLGILYDLYLHDAHVAKFYYLHYQSTQTVEDSRVKVWLGDLQQRLQQGR